MLEVELLLDSLLDCELLELLPAIELLLSLEAELELINAKIEREYKIMGDGCYMPPYCNVRKIYDADMNFVAIEQIY